jgi:hypothetical protein
MLVPKLKSPSTENLSGWFEKGGNCSILMVFSLELNMKLIRCF